MQAWKLTKQASQLLWKRVLAPSDSGLMKFSSNGETEEPKKMIYYSGFESPEIEPSTKPILTALDSMPVVIRSKSLLGIIVLL